MDIFSQYKGLKKEVYIVSFCKVIDRMGSLVGPMFTILLSVKLRFDATTIAKWMMINSLASIPIHLLGGRLADKINKKALINVCDISSALIYIMCGFMALNETTIIIYLFASLLQHAEAPAYHNLIADNTKSTDRERAYSLMYVAANFGSAIAPILGGMLIDNHTDLLFIIAGVVQLISVVFFNLYISDTETFADKDNIYEAISDKTSIFSILNENRVVLCFALITTITVIAYHQFSYLIPLQQTAINPVNGSKIYGTMCSVNCIVVLLFTSVMTTLLRKMSGIHKMMLGEFLQMLGYIIIAYNALNVVMLYAGTFIFTLGEITETISANPYYLNRIPANYRGRFESLNEVFKNIISNLCLIVIGNIYDTMGVIVTWNIVFVLLVVAIVLYGSLSKADKKAYPDIYIKLSKIS